MKEALFLAFFLILYFIGGLYVIGMMDHVMGLVK